MILAHKIRLIPTEKDITYFRKCCGVARFTYNWALGKWCEGYKKGNKPTATKLKKEFNAIKKKEFPWVYGVTKTASEQTFSDLGKAFKNFFTGQAKYPKFKKKGKSKDSFYIANDKFQLDGKKVRIPKLGWVRMREELRFSGKIMGARVSSVADKWFISVSVETHDKYNMVNGRDSVGVDLGVKQLATMTTGEIVEGPKPIKHLSRRLRRFSKGLSRKKKGSKNREKGKRKLSKLHARIAYIRNDALHKLTNLLTTKFSRIAIEDLNVKGMSQNSKLSKAILDMGFGEFRRQLEYKAKLNFSELGIIDRFFPSSKLCSNCKNKKLDLKLSDRMYKCSQCGLEIDRDLNASINILEEAFPDKA